MGPSGLTFTGYIYISAGAHEISASSDDGFTLKLGGVDFAEFQGKRPSDETVRVAEFEDGFYKIDISCFDAGGADEINGGYGDDVIDGGRGSDLISGGAGDDLLISRSDAGEQRIGQLADGNPTRPDPDNEVNYDRHKLKGWEYQPLVSDDVLIGGEGNDTFLISPQINAKLDIIEKHLGKDGVINWAGVAGENDELHDRWTDSFGIDVIADYVAGEDQIASSATRLRYSISNAAISMATDIMRRSFRSPRTRAGPASQRARHRATARTTSRALAGRMIRTFWGRSSSMATLSWKRTSSPTRA